MQGIAYKINGEPRVTWPVITEVIDGEGNHTGETISNLDQLIAELPEGTDYQLVDEAETEAWWGLNRPAPGREERAAAIKADLDRLDRASIRPLRAIENRTNTPDDDARLMDIDQQAASLRAELADLNG